MKMKIFLITFFLLTGCNGYSQKPVFLEYEKDPWVKQKMEVMTLREKIGQLIMIDIYPAKGESDRVATENLIRKYKPGGVLIMNGSPTATASWINTLQSISEIPLLTAIDGESGVGFRLDSITPFPNAQSLGAIQDNQLIFKLGQAIGEQMKRIGIRMNFGPVADINSNPDNPVISIRSFGEERENVSLKAIAFTNGLQSAGVAAVAKHFPGHGDTRTDSHLVPPEIAHSIARIDSVELVPFKMLIERGIAGIMTGHLIFPVVDASGKPASLSEKMIGDILKKKMGFSGLVITDAMNMGGLTLPRGKAEVQALKAGNDLLEFLPDLSGAFAEIEKAVITGTLSIDEINEKCRRILAMKRWLGLHAYRPVELKGLAADLDHPEICLLKRKLVEASITVLNNNNLIPIQRLDTLNIATVAIGAGSISPFQLMADKYAGMDHYFLPKDASPEEMASLFQSLGSYNLVIAGILNTGNYPRRNYNTSATQIESLRTIIGKNRVITLFFGNTYAMKYFPGIEESEALVQAYQPDPLNQELAVQLVFGATDAGGRLPVTSSARFPAGSGQDVKGNMRLKYTIPEEAGIPGAFLETRIDSIVKAGLTAGAYPGCQVLIAREGKVIFHKCYGYLTYKNDEPLTPSHLYDFASVTKVSGPLPVLIKLVDEGNLNLDRKMSDYLPLLKNCNKENIVIRDVLAHQAQLPAIIPFWNSRLSKNQELREKVFSEHPISINSIRISSRLWMERKYIDTMYQEIRDIPLLKTKKYHYTCMGFTLWPLVIKNITGQSYETFLKNNIYKPLGASTLTYNPWKTFPICRMVPTESDDYFRHEVLRGYVHDEGAAMLGGVSGNAGLFGTAGDLAKLFQMYLWKGTYGGQRFFSEKTFDMFNTVHFRGNDNRRGLGFDKPALDNDKKSPEEAYPCKGAGKNSFGHSGYTGTWVWADPDQGILCIVFTNRVYPTRNNDLLSGLKIRGSVLQAVYDAIDKGKMNH